MLEIIADPKVLISIIAAVTTIIGAIITIVNTRVTFKRTAENARELEILKLELEQKKSYAKIPEAHINLRLMALDGLISGLQKVKDDVILIMQAHEKMLGTKSALMMMKTSREMFFSVYADQSIHLESADIEAAHDAKNLVFSAENLLIEFTKNGKFVELIANEKAALNSLRGQITDSQNILRDIKLQIIYKF